MKKIVVNARFLEQPMTGVQRYAANLCLFLADQPLDIDFVCPPQIQHEILAQRIRAIKIGTHKGRKWEQRDLPSYLKKQGDPLLLNLGNTAPLRYSRNISTLHDLSIYRYPQSFSWKFRKYYQFMIPRMVKKSLALITVSEFSRQEIQHFFKDMASKTFVIGNAVLNIPENPPAKKGAYFLCVNSWSSRKNIPTLLHAYREMDVSLPLYLRGEKQKIYKGGKRIEILVQQDPRIVPFETWDDYTYKQMLGSAFALVNPSFYEGFGLPNLEAMAEGIPVVASDIPVFREICGDAALYFDPINPRDLHQQLTRLQQDTELQQELTEKGRTQAQKFHIQVQGKKLISLLHTIS